MTDCVGWIGSGWWSQSSVRSSHPQTAEAKPTGAKRAGSVGSSGDILGDGELQRSRRCRHRRDGRYCCVQQQNLVQQRHSVHKIAELAGAKDAVVLGVGSARARDQGHKSVALERRASSVAAVIQPWGCFAWYRTEAVVRVDWSQHIRQSNEIRAKNRR